MNDVHEQDRAWQDPIVAEVRAVRSTLFAASGNDIREFCRRLREEQPVSGHVIVTRASQSGQEPARTESSSPLVQPAGSQQDGADAPDRPCDHVAVARGSL